MDAKTTKLIYQLIHSLCNRYNKNKSQDSWNASKKQRNRCDKMLRPAKIDYYKTLDIKYLVDNLKFWKKFKPLFSDKIQAPSKIALLENEVLVTDDKEVAEIFDEYFVSTTDSLGINQPKDALQDIDGISDPVEIAIQNYSSHPSVELISLNTKPSHSFAFTFVANSRVSAELRDLQVKKASHIDSIPSKILRDNLDIFTDILQQNFNASIEDGIFPTVLKRGEVTCVFKGNDQMTKSNYRPITAKVYERLMSEQMEAYSETFFSPYLCGFRKGYNTQQALVRFVEKCKSVLDKKGFAGAILMDLSQAFDCLNHELLIAKLSAYGFSLPALKLIYTYLHEIQQRVKINGSFNTLKQTSL